MKLSSSTITLTFGDQAENHVGMQKLGELATCGFSLEDLHQAQIKFERAGCECEFIFLSDFVDIDDVPDAAVLIIRQGLDTVLEPMGANDLDMLLEQQNLEWDSKAKMYGRVVQKHARHNLCYGDATQEPDYENGLGRIISWDQIPCTKFFQRNIHKYVGSKAKNLVAEGNLYFDLKKCGISHHGDSERKKVIAVRLGGSMPLCYQWFFNNEPIGHKIKLMLNHGDIYIMSEIATGNNWKKKLIPTLRHAAGSKKYLTIKKN